MTAIITIIAIAISHLYLYHVHNQIIGIKAAIEALGNSILIVSRTQLQTIKTLQALIASHGLPETSGISGISGISETSETSETNEEHLQITDNIEHDLTRWHPSRRTKLKRH